MSEACVCFFNSCRHWGGGEKWHHDMALRLAQRGRRVLLVAHPRGPLSRRAEAAALNPRGLSISNLSWLNPLTIWRIARLLRAEGVDVLILNLPSDLKAAGIAARLAKVRKVIYRRGSAIPIRDNRLNRFLLGRCVDLVLANSEATKATVRENNADMIDPERIVVVYNGIDLEEFDAAGGEPVTQRRGEELILGSAGRLVEQKNQGFLLEVARRLKDKGLPFRLILAGEGPLSAELRNRAAALDLSREVRFLGFVEDMRGFMTSLDLFLLSSHWEGFAYVLVEAMAARRPVLSFDASNEGEIVVHGETGYLVSPGDLEAFVRRIEAFHADRGKIQQMGLRGRAEVEARFGMDRALEGLIGLLA